MKQEEKARAYDKALAKAKEQYNYPCMRSCMGILEEIFPELAESEDERSKNAAIRACKYMVDNFENSTKQYEEAIAWIEKQGQQILANSAKTCKDEQKPIEMKTAEESLGIDSDTYNKIVDECIFGEQKPTDKVEPKFKVGDKIYLKPEYRMPDDDTPIANTVFEIRAIDDKHYIFYGSYIFIEDQDKYELVEQKSAWSEEDERMLHTIIADFKGFIRDNTSTLESHFNECIDWLKSIKQRYT